MFCFASRQRAKDVTLHDKRDGPLLIAMFETLSVLFSTFPALWAVGTSWQVTFGIKVFDIVGRPLGLLIGGQGEYQIVASLRVKPSAEETKRRIFDAKSDEFLLLLVQKHSQYFRIEEAFKQRFPAVAEDA